MEWGCELDTVCLQFPTTLPISNRTKVPHKFQLPNLYMEIYNKWGGTHPQIGAYWSRRNDLVHQTFASSNSSKSAFTLTQHRWKYHFIRPCGLPLSLEHPPVHKSSSIIELCSNSRDLSEFFTCAQYDPSHNQLIAAGKSTGFLN